MIGDRSRLGLYGVPRGAGTTFNRGAVVIIPFQKGFAEAHDARLITASAADGAVTIAEGFNE